MASAGSGAHQKGNNFERAVSKKLSKAWQVEVNRTAYSGSTSNASAQAGLSGFTGDLFVTPSSKLSGIFSFELKNHANFRLRHIFMNNGEYPSYLEQCVEDSRRQGSVPVLILHVTREDDYVVIPHNKTYLAWLRKNNYPAMEVLSSYTNSRTQQTNDFEMLVTNLKAFCATPQKILLSYRGSVWDKLNRDKQPKEFDNDLDKIMADLDKKESS